jgi:hypothetical protein
MSTYARAPRHHGKSGRPPVDPPKGLISKTARHAKIITLLEQHEVRSQTELAELLADDGVQVTQGTLSRDLVEIGALRVAALAGTLSTRCRARAATGRHTSGSSPASRGGWPACVLRSWYQPRHPPTSWCFVRRPARRSISHPRSIGSAGSRSWAPSQVTTRSC